MSAPDDINAMLVALRVLGNPKTFRVSTHETLAMAGCLVGLGHQLDAAEDAITLQPTTNARLAAAVASFLLKDEELEASRSPDGYVPLPAFAARKAALDTLRTIFETEFPK